MLFVFETSDQAESYPILRMLHRSPTEAVRSHADTDPADCLSSNNVPRACGRARIAGLDGQREICPDDSHYVQILSYSCEQLFHQRAEAQRKEPSSSFRTFREVLNMRLNPNM